MQQDRPLASTSRNPHKSRRCNAWGRWAVAFVAWLTIAVYWLVLPAAHAV